MVSAQNSVFSGPGFEPWPGHRVVFRGQDTLYSHSASLHQFIKFTLACEFHAEGEGGGGGGGGGCR